MTQHIIPRFKLILYYDIAPEQLESYYQFVMGELLPGAQEMGLYMFRVFHTAWGNGPLRQAEFVAEELDSVQDALGSDRWEALEKQLQIYVTNYHRKLVRFRPGFQL